MAGKTTKELIDELRPIFQEYPDLLRKHQWKELADVLNARGITMAKNLPWNDTSLETFLDRYGSRFELRDMQIQDRQDLLPEPSQEEPKATEAPAEASPPTLAPITPNTVIDRLAPLVEDLTKMVNEWKQAEATPQTTGERRPKFKRGADTSTRTVRLGNQLIRDAERYAEKHKRETGGTFSGLVELLLWERLGRSSKYLASVTLLDSGAQGE